MKKADMLIFFNDVKMLFVVFLIIFGSSNLCQENKYKTVQ